MLRDITEIEELAQLKNENEMLGLINSSVSHEMLTPLRCIIQVGQQLKYFLDSPQQKMCDTIISAAGMTMSQVKCNLDRCLIDKGTFSSSPQRSTLSKVVNEAVDIVQP